MASGKSAVKTAKKQRGQRGRPFEPGKSGNPNGRPKGRKEILPKEAADLLADSARAITTKVLMAALKSDERWAIELVFGRIHPPAREKKVKIDLPPIETAEDARKALSKILEAVASGEITPGEGESLSRLAQGFVQTFEVSELSKEVAAMRDVLERQANQGGVSIDEDE